MDWWPVNREIPKEPGLNIKDHRVNKGDHCDACATMIGPFEQITRGGMTLYICKEPRGCRARQPSMDVMAGGIRR